MKRAHHNISEPNKTYSDCLFFPILSPTPKEIQFTVIENKEKLQILKLGGGMEPAKLLIDSQNRY